MTPTGLHSAILEVGLFYEKHWSEERIARFTDRLNRRRLREQKAAARAQAVARAPVPSPTVAFQVEQPHPAGIAYAIAPTTADPRTARERLVDGIRAQLSESSDSQQTEAIEGPAKSEEGATPTRTGWR